MLLVYEGPIDLGYQSVAFATDTEERALVEIATEGRQFVASGIHPGTQRPYEWPEGIPLRSSLTIVDHSALEAFLGAVEQAFPKARRSGSERHREHVDQSRLNAPPDVVMSAVSALPNDSRHFPERQDWLTVGYAIKAAFGPGREDEALEVFDEWSAKWADGDNDPQYR